MPEAFIFGKYYEDFEPTPENIGAMLERSRDAREKMAKTSVYEIIDVLDRFSKAWSDPANPFRAEAWEYLSEQTRYSRQMLELGFSAVGFITSRECVEKRLSSELHARFAERRMDRLEKADFSGMEKIVPLGNVLHVSASNVFISAVDSLVSGFVTKNVNFLKLSRGDTRFPVILGRALQAVDKNSLLAESFAAFYFKGGDEEAERLLSEKMDGVVVWGGAEAVAGWRKNASVRSRVIEYGPKISFSLVDLSAVGGDGELSAICSGLASDVSIWEQAACSSPQNVYVVESKKIGAEKFCERLFEALTAKNAELPQKELSLDEKVEILKARERAVSAKIAGDGGDVLFRRDGSSPTVVLSSDEKVETSPLFRTIIVKRVPKVERFYDAIAGVGFFLQAVSVHAAPASRHDIAEKLYSLGVNRVLRPGCHGAPPEGAPHDGKHLLGQLVRYVSFEFPDESSETAALLSDSESVLAAARARLKNIVTVAAGTSEYYKKVIDPKLPAASGDRFMKLFEKVPFLGKDQIYSNCLPESTAMISRGDLSASFVFASGGTTGEPKFSVYSNDELEFVTDLLASIYRVAGIRSKNRVANLFLAGSLWTSFIVANLAVQKIGATNLPIGGNIGFDTMLKFFRLLKPDAIVGLPSIIIKFCEYCESEGAFPRVETVLYGGEHMREPARRQLQKVFGVKKIVSAGYAAVDCGPIGFQCGSLPGSLHHVLTDYQYVEFIKPDGTAAKAGETGEIVVTNLDRKRMPVIRFRTGDLGTPLSYECPCGRKNAVFELLGRCDDIIIIGGANITPHDFEEAIADFPELSSIFQIVGLTVGGRDAIELNVELKRAEDVGAPRLAALGAKLVERLREHSYKLRAAVEQGWLASLEARILPPGAIERVARTGKAIVIKDKRVK